MYTKDPDRQIQSIRKVTAILDGVYFSIIWTT